jgi:hypothetical protein
VAEPLENSQSQTAGETCRRVGVSAYRRSQIDAPLEEGRGLEQKVAKITNWSKTAARAYRKRPEVEGISAAVCREDAAVKLVPPLQVSVPLSTINNIGGEAEFFDAVRHPHKHEESQQTLNHRVLRAMFPLLHSMNKRTSRRVARHRVLRAKLTRAGGRNPFFAVRAASCERWGALEP